MIDDKKPLALGSPAPGIDASINGAPATMPGTGSGGKGSTTSNRIETSGTWLGGAVAPPAVAPELAGSPYHVVGPQYKPEQSPTAQTQVTTGSEKKEPASTAEAMAESAKISLQNTGAPDAPKSAPKLRDNPMREATMGYDMQIQTLREAAQRYAPETEDERKKRERKEKSRKIMAAVSDGISALSNLYFTSQYAPNMYHHERSSQLSPLERRLEQAKAERQKDADRYLDFSLKIGDLNNARAATVRELEAQQEARRLAREKAQREQQEHQWKAVLQRDVQREAKGKADKAGYDAETARVKSKYEPKQQDAKLKLTNAKTATEETKQKYNIAKTADAYASADAHKGEFEAWDEYGQPHYFHGKDEADRFAKQHGTWKVEEVKSTSSSSTTTKGQRRDVKKTTTKTQTKQSGYPARPFNVAKYKRGGNSKPPLN